MPEGFRLEDATGLGLSIVRTLVTTELVGTISLQRSNGPAGRYGTVVRIDVPVVERQ